jgi:hypothetical protein
VEQAWNDVDQGIIDSLVRDFPRRCQMVRDVGGASISQQLSSHIAAIRLEDRKQGTAEVFTPQEDEEKVRFIEEQDRRRWNQLADKMPTHQKAELKNLTNFSTSRG